MLEVSRYVLGQVYQLICTVFGKNRRIVRGMQGDADSTVGIKNTQQGFRPQAGYSLARNMLMTSSEVMTPVNLL